ncbi:cytochrome P450 [uncultured Ilumatobacter sp.]|jgi:cytochrome P450|uniref:cytochrome P450 n=1 Tax=uncultured Ilumatobacter sp. TaxID=879968 RepID=UPI00374E8AF8
MSSESPAHDVTIDDRIAAMACPVERTILDPAVQDDPWDFYNELHTQCPVFPIPEIGGVMVTKYEDVRFVLTRPDLFSNSGRVGGAKKGLQVDNARRYREILRLRGWPHVETLQRCDPPEHTAYRRLVGQAFLPRQIKAIAPQIDEISTELINGLIDAGQCEFNLDYAMPLPGIVIAEQLGLDRSEIHRFNRWAHAMLALSMRPLTESELVETAEVELEAQHHLAAVFEQRRAEPSDDLISTLVHAHEGEEGAEQLTVAELQNLMHQLITGGFETTTSALNHGMWLLTRRPYVQDRLRSDLSLIPAFIEETLRFESPVQGLVRTATQDVEVSGVVIPEGSIVMVRYAAANRDEAMFDRAADFDLDRESTKHLAFGAGPHFCVGAALARQELITAFTHWIERTSSIELARPFEGAVHEPSFILFPMKELPLRFTRA